MMVVFSRCPKPAIIPEVKDEMMDNAHALARSPPALFVAKMKCPSSFFALLPFDLIRLIILHAEGSIGADWARRRWLRRVERIQAIDQHSHSMAEGLFSWT